MRDVHITQFIDKEEIIIKAKSAMDIVLIKVDCRLEVSKYLRFITPLFKWLFTTKVSVYKFNRGNKNDPVWIKDYTLTPGMALHLDHKFEIIIKN
jgi:hypothetical protein